MAASACRWRNGRRSTLSIGKRYNQSPKSQVADVAAERLQVEERAKEQLCQELNLLVRCLSTRHQTPGSSVHDHQQGQL